jgi:hypothetical protein
VEGGKNTHGGGLVDCPYVSLGRVAHTSGRFLSGCMSLRACGPRNFMKIAPG